jgi:hypothetical protein
MWMPGDGEIVDAVLLSETVYFGFPWFSWWIWETN